MNTKTTARVSGTERPALDGVGLPVEVLAAAVAEDNLNMEEKRRLRALAYGHVFGSKEGRQVLDDLMRVAGWHMGVEASSFYDNASHAQMAFREGQREVVRHILRLTRNNNNNQAQE